MIKRYLNGEKYQKLPATKTQVRSATVSPDIYQNEQIADIMDKDWQRLMSMKKKKDEDIDVHEPIFI